MEKQNIMNFKVVDACFINSLKSIKSSTIFIVLLQLLQFVAMAIMIPIDLLVSKDSQPEVVSFFIAATCVTFINMGANFIHYRCYQCDSYLLQIIAQQLNHLVDVPNQQHPIDYYCQIPYSKVVYNIQNNLTVSEVDQAMKKIVEPQLANTIQILVLSRDPCNKCITSIGGCCSFGLFIYGIVIMATIPLQTTQLVVMIIYCVSETLIQRKLFACLVFIALLPLLCLLFCIYACFCSDRQRPANLPEAKNATVEIIQKSDGASCAICFQSIMVEESVITLPCSQKHIFHENCIKGWINVKSTCPICRYDLSQ